jgi:hypothetical protein
MLDVALTTGSYALGLGAAVVLVWPTGRLYYEAWQPWEAAYEHITKDDGGTKEETCVGETCVGATANSRVHPPDQADGCAA